MQIHVPLGENGYLPDRFGKHADDSEKLNGHAVRSLPIEIKDVPDGAKSLALTLIDYDAVQVSRFAWIHWLAANVSPETSLIPENASADLSIEMVQGANSYGSFFVGETDRRIINRYAGPAPPDKDHDYTLTVYALDNRLDLADGYLLNNFYRAIRGHVLDTAELDVKYRV
jgi:Raf kinase inhibitor-like YbhB/YbcL family protein